MCLKYTKTNARETNQCLHRGWHCMVMYKREVNITINEQNTKITTILWHNTYLINQRPRVQFFFLTLAFKGKNYHKKEPWYIFILVLRRRGGRPINLASDDFSIDSWMKPHLSYSLIALSFPIATWEYKSVIPGKKMEGDNGWFNII